MKLNKETIDQKMKNILFQNVAIYFKFRGYKTHEDKICTEK